MFYNAEIYMNKYLYFFDLKSTSFNRENIQIREDPKLDLAVKEYCSKNYIAVQISQIDDAEGFAKNYYQSKNFRVLFSKRCKYFSQQDQEYELYKEVLKFLANNFLFNNQKCDVEQWEKYLSGTGSPDFIVYRFSKNEITNLRFVEVKKLKDSLKFEQFSWAYATNVPVTICFVDNVLIEKSISDSLEHNVFFPRT